MPTEFYRLEPDGPRLLEVSWEGTFDNVAIRYDGHPVAEGLSRADLRAGYTCRLPDRSKLTANIGKNILPELHLLRNGAPLPDFELIRRVRFAGWIALLFSGIALILGVLPLLGGSSSFGPEVTAGIAAAAVIFAVLAVFIFRRSAVAVIIAAVLCSSVGLVLLGYAVTTGQFGIGTLMFILAPIPVIQAIKPALALRANQPR